MKRKVVLIVLFCALPFTVFGQGFQIESWHFNGGLAWVVNEVYDAEPADQGTDTLKGSLGFGFKYAFSENLYFSPSLFLFMDYYDYLENRELSMPIDPAHAEQLLCLGLFWDVSVGYRLPLEKLKFGGQAGPAFLTRFPLYGPGEDSRSDMTASFYSEGRFVYLSAAIWGEYPFAENLAIQFRVQTYIPIFNLWTSDDLPFTEGWGNIFSAGLVWYPKPRSKPTPSPAESLPE